MHMDYPLLTHCVSTHSHNHSTLSLAAHLQRTCTALCEAGLQSCSPTVRMQACEAAAAVLSLLHAGQALNGQAGTDQKEEGLSSSVVKCLSDLAAGLLKAVEQDSRQEVGLAALDVIQALLHASASQQGEGLKQLHSYVLQRLSSLQLGENAGGALHSKAQALVSSAQQ